MLKGKTFLYLSAFFILFLFQSENSNSQITVDAPNINKASSQLLYYYDQTSIDENAGGVEPDTVIQVTNTNDTQGITVHVQIFRSFDPDDSGPGAPVICDERDFIDFLTPNDTHIYDLSSPNFPKNTGENETTAGESTSIDVSDENLEDGTKGFVIITPVVSESDLTAVSFPHLIGNSMDYQFHFLLNARGRDAVDFITGEELPDFTPLDGVNNGFEIVRSEVGSFSFSNDYGPAFTDLVFISIQDVYGEPGLLGYNISPATSSFSTFIYDYKEDVTSCGSREFSCFLTVGINDTFPQNNTELSNGNDVLCAGVESPLNPAILPPPGREIDLTIATIQEPGEDEAQGYVKFFFDTGNEASQISQEVTPFASFFNIGVTSPDPCACAKKVRRTQGRDLSQVANIIEDCPIECFQEIKCPPECFMNFKEQLRSDVPITNLNGVYCPIECCVDLKESFNLLELICPI